jgi:hypothetical protein
MPMPRLERQRSPRGGRCHSSAGGTGRRNVRLAMMRLEFLAELSLEYGDEGFLLVRPYGTEEGSGWGGGEGRLEGERLRGSVRWLNAPHRRSDVVMLPHCHGRIATDDGATILFLMDGRTPLTGDEADEQLLRLSFETDDPRYAWLNTAFVVAEGVIRADPPGSEHYVMHARVYRCLHELLASSA